MQQKTRPVKSLSYIALELHTATESDRHLWHHNQEYSEFGNSAQFCLHAAYLPATPSGVPKLRYSYRFAVQKPRRTGHRRRCSGCQPQRVVSGDDLELSAPCTCQLENSVLWQLTLHPACLPGGPHLQHAQQGCTACGRGWAGLLGRVLLQALPALPF